VVTSSFGTTVTASTRVSSFRPGHCWLGRWSSSSGSQRLKSPHALADVESPFAHLPSTSADRSGSYSPNPRWASWRRAFLVQSERPGRRGEDARYQADSGSLDEGAFVCLTDWRQVGRVASRSEERRERQAPSLLKDWICNPAGEARRVSMRKLSKLLALTSFLRSFSPRPKSGPAGALPGRARRRDVHDRGRVRLSGHRPR
jgi:hypothetical protein